MKIVGPSIICLTSLSAITLYIVNYKKNKHKKQTVNT